MGVVMTCYGRKGQNHGLRVYGCNYAVVERSRDGCGHARECRGTRPVGSQLQWHDACITYKGQVGVVDSTACGHVRERFAGVLLATKCPKSHRPYGL